MTIYRPFLKTTRSNLDAALASDAIGTTIQPVWELIPMASATPSADLAQRLAGSSRRVPWRIDARHLAGGEQSTVSVIDAACRASGVTYIPVIAPGATTDDMDAAAAAIDVHGNGLTVRMASPGGRVDIDAATGVARSLDVPPAHVDLVLDCGFIPDAATAALTAGALLVPLHRALARGWRSVTVLSGAFPTAPAGAPRTIPRHDAALFRQLPFAVDFGDFGVAHPVASPADETTVPSLRRNRGNDWIVYRDGEAMPRSGRTSHGLAISDDPSKWAEWSTTHHMAEVRRQLDKGAA